MNVHIIAAASVNDCIGINNGLPWSLPNDLKFFKRTTIGKPVIMGRKTFESMNSRPLPGRLYVILTRNENYEVPVGVLKFNSLEAAIADMKSEGVDECFVIGGEAIFCAAIDIATKIYLTRVDVIIPEGDAFFTGIDPTIWEVTYGESNKADDKHKHDYTFLTYERIK